MIELIQQWVNKIPNIDGYQTLATSALALVAIALISMIAFFIVKLVLIKLINKLIAKTRSNLDDVLIKHNVFSRVAYLVPAYLVYP